jgi:hypothetical protein
MVLIRMAEPMTDAADRAEVRPADGPCPGRLAWLLPSPGTRACTDRGGHPGDHRDVEGRRWNDERWLD